MATSNKGRKRKPLSVRQVALKHGFRSGLEDTIAAKLKADGVPYRYEEVVINYIKPARKAKYTPDFVLENGIIIESKGRFVVADRQKHLFVKEQHPELDIRFVFSNSKQRISKASTTTYADWCIKHGFKFSDKSIPDEWIRE
jgi:hypothetical protein